MFVPTFETTKRGSREGLLPTATTAVQALLVTKTHLGSVFNNAVRPVDVLPPKRASAAAAAATRTSLPQPAGEYLSADTLRAELGLSTSGSSSCSSAPLDDAVDSVVPEHGEETLGPLVQHFHCGCVIMPCGVASLHSLVTGHPGADSSTWSSNKENASPPRSDLRIARTFAEAHHVLLHQAAGCLAFLDRNGLAWGHPRCVLRRQAVAVFVFVLVLLFAWKNRTCGCLLYTSDAADE